MTMVFPAPVSHLALDLRLQLFLKCLVGFKNLIAVEEGRSGVDVGVCRRCTLRFDLAETQREEKSEVLHFSRAAAGTGYLSDTGQTLK